jgi:hypothetical protein
MQLFLKLFEPYLQWFYHCFDRIVINGHLLGLMRESQIVYFFRDVCGHPKLTKELLRQRSQDYQVWVERFAHNHKVPLVWAEKHVRKEQLVASRQQRRLHQGQFGVYFIIKSREAGWTFRLRPPKFPTADPNYQIVSKQRSFYTHYYFYILDPVAGPLVLRVGSFLPFALTAYLNGHSFLERALSAHKVKFVKQDNRFVSVADPAQLQAAADRLDGKTLQQRIDYWAFILAPKFSARERAACGGLRRLYVMEQIEYCRNFIFKRSWPIRSIFQRSCELGLYLLTADRIVALFGKHNTRRIRGKLQNVMERVEHGQQVFRTWCRNSFLKQYEKAATFLRLELVSNNVRDFGLKKSLAHWPAMRERFQQITDRFAAVQAQNLNVHGQLDVLARLAQPVIQGKTKVAGIKLEQKRILRLLEVLLQAAAGNLKRWTTTQLRDTVLDQCGLKQKDYTLNQIRYDLRKLRLHGLIERIPHTHAYRFTQKGYKLALLLIQLRKRIYGPLAFGNFRHRQIPSTCPTQPSSGFITSSIAISTKHSASWQPEASVTERLFYQILLSRI